MIELKFDKDEDWSLEVKFEEIKTFRNTGMYSMVREGESDGCVMVNICEYDFEEPQDFQKKALNYFNDNQKKVLDAMCLGLMEYYPKLMEIYDVTEFEDDYFPKLSTIDDVRKIIGIGNIHLLDDQKDGIGYIGFECGCPWDEEHGLGIIMHLDRVIDVGQADISFSGSKELRKDNGTYTEEEKLRDEEWEKKRLANIEKYKREQETQKDASDAEDEIASNKENIKWWQFWKK